MCLGDRLHNGPARIGRTGCGRAIRGWQVLRVATGDRARVSSTPSRVPLSNRPVELNLPSRRRSFGPGLPAGGAPGRLAFARPRPSVWHVIMLPDRDPKSKPDVDRRATHRGLGRRRLRPYSVSKRWGRRPAVSSSPGSSCSTRCKRLPQGHEAGDIHRGASIPRNLFRSRVRKHEATMRGDYSKSNCNYGLL